jgi:DNA-binding transcriptional regulator GbsR (MarR family)
VAGVGVAGLARSDWTARGATSSPARPGGILSYVVLNGRSGTTFDDLVTNLCASKSTISTHINHLLGIKKIVYFTKSGDRKKYFTINEDSIILSIDEMIDSWTKLKDLHIEIKLYKESVNALETSDSNSKFDSEFHVNYIKFIDDVTKSLSELKAKILEIQTQKLT